METCECIQHSDGGCPIDIVATAGNGTEAGIDTTTDSQEESGTGVEAGDLGDSGGVEVSSGTVTSSASPGATGFEGEIVAAEKLVAAELGADGRLLQENRQAITTDLEIKFITDVEVRIGR